MIEALANCDQRLWACCADRSIEVDRAQLHTIGPCLVSFGDDTWENSVVHHRVVATAEVDDLGMVLLFYKSHQDMVERADPVSWISFDRMLGFSLCGDMTAPHGAVDLEGYFKFHETRFSIIVYPAWTARRPMLRAIRNFTPPSIRMNVPDRWYRGEGAFSLSDGDDGQLSEMDSSAEQPASASGAIGSVFRNPLLQDDHVFDDVDTSADEQQRESAADAEHALATAESGDTARDKAHRRRSSNSAELDARLRQSRRRMQQLHSLIEHNNGVFDVDIFLEQFFVHVFHPLSVPYVLLSKGLVWWNNLHGNRVHIGHYLWPFYEHIAPAALWVAVLLAMSMPSNNDTTMTDAGMAFLYFCLHRATISVKYAFLTRESYLNLLNEENYQLAWQAKSILQLGMGWLQPNIITLKAEIRQTAADLNISLRDSNFEISEDADMQERWRKLLFDSPANAHIHVPVGSNGLMSRVPSSAALLAIYSSAAKETTQMLKWGKYCMYGVATLRAGLAVLFRLRREDATFLTAMGSTNAEVAVTVFAMLGNFLYYSTLLALLLVSYVDFVRRLRVAQLIGRMCRFERHENDLPYLDLSVAANSTAWMHLREMSQTLGKRYVVRIRTITGFFMAFSLALVLFVAVRILIASTSGEVTSGLDTLLVNAVTYDVLLWSVMIFLMVLRGASTNDISQRDLMRLHMHKMKLHDAYYGGHKPAQLMAQLRSDYDHTETTIDTGRDSLSMQVRRLKLMDEVEAVTVMGLRADWALVNSLVTLLASALVFLVRQVAGQS